MLGVVLTGLAVLVGLSVVVTIHEAGHFLAARWAGVDVEAFAIGWGKVLVRWKPGRTEYRLCLLPLGGYCKMRGEQDLIAAMGRADGAFDPTPGSLFAAKPWQRIAISVAGPLANLVFALVLLTGLQLVGHAQVVRPPVIELAQDVDGRTDTPAEHAGLATRDLILAVNGRPVSDFPALQAAIAGSPPGPQTWSISRQGLTLEKTVVPVYDAVEKRPLVGVYPWNESIVRSVTRQSTAALAGFAVGDRVTAVDGVPVATEQAFWYRYAKTPTDKSWSVTVQNGGVTKDLLIVPDQQTKAEGLGLAFVSVAAVPGLPLDRALLGAWAQFGVRLTSMVDGLVRLFTGKLNPMEALSGPIGIVRVGSDVATAAFDRGPGEGWTTVADLFVALNLALFLMNLLPIPALDGGNVVVSVVEGVRRRRLSLKALIRYQQVGAVIVLALILFTTFNDLGRWFTSQ